MSEKMSVDETREVMQRYFSSDHDDTSMMADDVVFEDMLTGDRYTGPDGVQAMLDYLYHTAFDGRAEIHNVVYGEGHAILEATFHGTQKTEFAGMANSGMQVSAPLVVSYDCADGKLVWARIYSMTVPVMRMQLAEG